MEDTDPTFSTNEIELIGVIRSLADQDGTFRHLLPVLLSRLSLMYERGQRFNVNGVTCFRHNFDRGDVTASVKTFDPISRLSALVADNRVEYSDAEIRDLLDDIGNYVDIWLCCRERRRELQDKREGA